VHVGRRSSKKIQLFLAAAFAVCRNDVAGRKSVDVDNDTKVDSISSLNEETVVINYVKQFPTTEGKFAVQQTLHFRNLLAEIKIRETRFNKFISTCSTSKIRNVNSNDKSK